MLTENFLSFDWWINRLLTDFFFENKIKLQKSFSKFFSIFFSKIDRIFFQI